MPPDGPTGRGDGGDGDGDGDDGDGDGPGVRRGATGGRGSSVVRRGGGRGSADEPRDEGALSVAAGEREFGFCFFVFSDFCDWSTFLFALKNWR